MLFKKLLLLMVFAAFVIASVAIAQEKQNQKKSEKSKIEKGNPMVIMKTSLGAIKLELFIDKAPVTVKNFMNYVDEKFYDNTIFHRVIKTFMIQGGGFTSSDPMKQKSTKNSIKNESNNGLKNDRGTIAMARMQDPNSASSQFFINVVDNNSLNPGGVDPSGYAVFGKVIEGMDIVDKIRDVQTGNAKGMAFYQGKEFEQSFQNVPITKVIVESVRRFNQK